MAHDVLCAIYRLRLPEPVCLYQYFISQNHYVLLCGVHLCWSCVAGSMCLLSSIRPILHRLNQFDVSAVIWWQDLSKPKGQLQFAVVVDAAGVFDATDVFESKGPFL